MNSEDLKLLKETLLKESKSINKDFWTEESKNQEYHLVDAVGYDVEDYKTITGRELIAKKKSGSEVAEMIMKMFVESIYTFHNTGFDELEPALYYEIAVPYIFNEDLMNKKKYFENSDRTLPTCGDIVKLDFGYTDYLLGYKNDEKKVEPEMFSEIYMKLEPEVECKTDEEFRAYKNKMHELENKGLAVTEAFYKRCFGEETPEDIYVSYNELAVELKNRGIYFNFESFDEISKDNTWITALIVCQKPLTEKKENIM